MRPYYGNRFDQKTFFSSWILFLFHHYSPLLLIGFCCCCWAQQKPLYYINILRYTRKFDCAQMFCVCVCVIKVSRVCASFPISTSDPSHMQEEKLDGENRYFCESCQGKQSATRRIKLNSLPPTLNLQLMRFIFDRSAHTFVLQRVIRRWAELIAYYLFITVITIIIIRCIWPHFWPFESRTVQSSVLAIWSHTWTEVCLSRLDKRVTRKSWTPSSVSLSSWTWDLFSTGNKVSAVWTSCTVLLHYWWTLTITYSTALKSFVLIVIFRCCELL